MGDSIKEMAGGITQQIGTFLPNIAAANWRIDHRLDHCPFAGSDRQVGGSQNGAWITSWRGCFPLVSRPTLAKLVGKIVYYIAMLFVFVTFFNVLDLPIVSKPLSGFLDSIFEFLPRIDQCFGARARRMGAWPRWVAWPRVVDSKQSTLMDVWQR